MEPQSEIKIAKNDIWGRVFVNVVSLKYIGMIYSVWARTTKSGVSLPVSGQRLIVFFGKLIMSRTQNYVIAVWIL